MALRARKVSGAFEKRLPERKRIEVERRVTENASERRKTLSFHSSFDARASSLLVRFRCSLCGSSGKRGIARSLYYFCSQAPVVRKVDNSIHFHHPADSVVCFVNTYPLDSDLSGG